MQFPFKNLSERNKLYLLSLLVGLGSGFAAVLLDFVIRLIRDLLTSGFSAVSSNWLYFVYPGAGMLISYLLVRYVVKDNIGHGVTKVLLAVSRNESRIKPHNTWSSMLTSSITIGFGGSVGAEAPIVYTGAAIGSNIGRAFNLSYRSVTTLLGCGAAGAVAGIFKAPLAGVLFTLEILLFNVSLSSMFPLLLSTVTATVVSYIFRGQAPVFQATLTQFSMANLPFYLVLGVASGFASLYFMRTTLRLEDAFAKMKKPYVRWLFCAIGLGVLIFFFPQLYGEGYDVVRSLLAGNDVSAEWPLSFFGNFAWGAPIFFLLVFFFKVIAMTFTNAGGGVGGTFGPTLFAGAILGFVVSRSINLIFPESIIAEISGGYDLLIPLIFTSTISFGTLRIFERYSIYTKRIAQSGDLLTHDSDQAVLTLMKTDGLIRDKYPRLHPDQTLRELVSVVSETTAGVIAVLDRDGRFRGMVDVASIHKMLVSVDKYDKVRVYSLMEQAPAIIYSGEKMEDVMSKFDRTGAWRLPVVTDDGTYLGFISRSRVLTAYREELKKISQED